MMCHRMLRLRRAAGPSRRVRDLLLPTASGRDATATADVWKRLLATAKRPPAGRSQGDGGPGVAARSGRAERGGTIADGSQGQGRLPWPETVGRGTRGRRTRAEGGRGRATAARGEDRSDGEKCKEGEDKERARRRQQQQQRVQARRTREAAIDGAIFEETEETAKRSLTRDRDEGGRDDTVAGRRAGPSEEKKAKGHINSDESSQPAGADDGDGTRELQRREEAVKRAGADVGERTREHQSRKESLQCTVAAEDETLRERRRREAEIRTDDRARAREQRRREEAIRRAGADNGSKAREHQRQEESIRIQGRNEANETRGADGGMHGEEGESDRSRPRWLDGDGSKRGIDHEKDVEERVLEHPRRRKSIQALRGDVAGDGRGTDGRKGRKERVTERQRQGEAMRPRQGGGADEARAGVAKEDGGESGRARRIPGAASGAGGARRPRPGPTAKERAVARKRALEECVALRHAIEARRWELEFVFGDRDNVGFDPMEVADNLSCYHRLRMEDLMKEHKIRRQELKLAVEESWN